MKHNGISEAVGVQQKWVQVGIGVDTDYFSRLDPLVDLMKVSPGQQMRKLQREALKFYPLDSTECIRHWMSKWVAVQAAQMFKARRVLAADVNTEK